MAQLRIPDEAHITPGGLRGGGAVSQYRAGVSLPSLLWKMRLKQQQTLESYIQEVAALSALTSLPPKDFEEHSSSRLLFPLSGFFSVISAQGLWTTHFVPSKAAMPQSLSTWSAHWIGGSRALWHPFFILVATTEFYFQDAAAFNFAASQPPSTDLCGRCTDPKRKMQRVGS